MVEVFGFEMFGGVGFGWITTLLTILVVVLFLAIPMFFLFFFLGKYIQFKHIIVVKMITGNGIMTVFDRAKTVKTKDGNLHWQLLRRKDKLPVPPKESIGITKRGALLVTLYYTEEGEYVFTKPNFDDKFIKEVPIKDKQGAIIDTTKIIDIGTDDPLTTNDRQFYSSQIKKAAEERGFLWTPSAMFAAGGAIFVLIMLTITFIYWEDIAAPASAIAGQYKGISEDFKEVTANLERVSNSLDTIINDKQRISSGGVN